MSDWGYSTEGFERSVYRIDGVETVVYEIGAGAGGRAPLVYFHGGGTYHGFEWARDFADSFRVILPYHPNFGESGDADFTSIEEYMLHYEMLFAILGLEEFHLMGASMGGHFAARYAGEHREEIDRLVLISPAGLVSEHASIPDYSKVSRKDLPALLVGDASWLAPYWPEEPSPAWMERRENEQRATMALRDDPATSDARLRVALAGFDRPTLFMWGSEDKIVPTGFIPDWQALLPDAQLAVIEGGGHLLLDEFPSARQAAKDFLLE